ncbi:PQQ-dependent sugar dehydrogenase [Sphingopyxis terrae]|uniref:PQQ-dependent sugar dehydrogenase n=1 Tax=Sphingopyxis terrae TaxID=33052 RepID=UPI003638A9CC
MRLNADGSVPDDNPFLARADALPELYSIGHRNVQGLVYDAQRQQLIAHEHGPRGGDELSPHPTPGNNYGWPIATGGLDYTWARSRRLRNTPACSPRRWSGRLLSPLRAWPSIGASCFPSGRATCWWGHWSIVKCVRVRWQEDGSAEDVEGLFGELDARIRDVRVGPEGAVYLLTDAPRANWSSDASEPQ